MLEPNSRRLLMESLQPPAGYRLDWAVGTTYTLDLMTLLTAPVAFAFSEFEDSDGRPICDPIALLKAVRQYAGQVCLFCQTGKIQVPRKYQPLMASIEDSIYQADAPQGGSFHPKMWFLRFTDRDEENSVMYRVLCSSRNLTFNRSWDTLLCLDGQLQDRVNAYSQNHPLGQFVESLPRMAGRPMTRRWKSRIKQLAHEIRRVEFEIPEPFREIDFWPLGIGLPDRWPFPERIDRLLVVSPFVDDGLIADLHDWQAPIQLVSRADQLGRLEPTTIESLDEILVLDDAAVPETGDAEEDEGGSEREEEEVAQETGELPLVGLHAKVFVVDEGRKARVFTGSANATRAGFNRNVEFVVELRGKKSQCGVDAILGHKSDEINRVSCLRDLLQPYISMEADIEVDEQTDKFERQVDQLAKTLGSSSLFAECVNQSDENTYSLRLGARNPPRLDSTLGQLMLRARPASLPGNQLADVDVTKARWAEYKKVSLLGLTSFFVFEVSSEELQLRRQFVLNVPLNNAPENRHEAILRDLLRDKERVLRFLMLLLVESGAREMSLFSESDGEGEGGFNFLGSILGGTLFEALMKSLSRSPERLEQVAEVIGDLERTSEGQSLLPEDLKAIWEPIWSVREEQLQKSERAKGRREK